MDSGSQSETYILKKLKENFTSLINSPITSLRVLFHLYQNKETERSEFLFVCFNIVISDVISDVYSKLK